MATVVVRRPRQAERMWWRNQRRRNCCNLSRRRHVGDDAGGFPVRITDCQKSLAEFAANTANNVLNDFRPRRTPEWPLLPLRGNSPSVRGRKYFSGCKCGVWFPKRGPHKAGTRFMGRGEARIQARFSAGRKASVVFGASTICAQQTAKYWRKSPKGFFDKFNPGRIFLPGSRRNLFISGCT